MRDHPRSLIARSGPDGWTIALPWRPSYSSDAGRPVDGHMLKIGAKGVRIGNVDIPAQELGEVKIERVLMGTGSAATEHYTLHVADQAVATNLGHEALTWIVEAIESIRIEPAADYWNERSAARAALRDLTERT